MQKKICIISSQHISSNPRVWKEALSLSGNGYDVTIVTINNSAVHRERDKVILNKLRGRVKYVVAANIIYAEIPLFQKIRYKFRGLYAKLLKKMSFDTVYLLSKAPGEIYTAALKVNADLYIAHTESSLSIGRKLIEKGKKVAFDIEDWYSRDYLNAQRPVNLLISMERYALHNAAYVTCPSYAMADALKNVYKSSKTPVVIYNSFPAELVEERKPNDVVSLVWFSQTTGPGRGLEKIINTLSHVSTPVKLVLIGTCSQGYQDKLNSIFPFSGGHTLQVLPQVSHDELHGILSKYDIGLALEEKYPDNKDKTISNKIFQYLQAGIKVLATDTEGQKEVAVNFPGAVQIVNAIDTADWHNKLYDLINRRVDKTTIIDKYKSEFSWQVQEGKLLQVVSNVI